MKIDTFLVLVCIECGKTTECPFNKTEQQSFAKALWKNGEWILSVVSPKGADKIVLAPVCGPCSAKVHPPEVLAALRKEIEKA